MKTVVESSVPAMVRGDPTRVRQVLTNFVQNAIKFTQIGEIDIRVSTRKVPAGTDVLLATRSPTPESGSSPASSP